MILHVVEAKHVKDHTVWLRFNDGVSGEVDLLDSLDGLIFEPLKNVDYFKLMTLDSELSTICWPNGADFAPEYLENKILIHVR